MKEYNDRYQIPILFCDNHEVWFQDISFKLCGKETSNAIEVSLKDYAWIRNLNATPQTGNSSTRNWRI